MVNLQVLNKINSWLADMGTDLLLFREYDWLLARNPDLRYILLNVYLDIIKFWALVIPHLRRDQNCRFMTVHSRVDEF